MESYASSSSGDSTSTGEIEMDNAVTSAVALAASFLQHVANPPRPVYQRVSVERDRAAANERLMKDYFDPVEPRYNEASFRRRFRMSSRLFLRIAQDLEREKPYFQQRCDARGRMGFTAIQKDATRASFWSSQETLAFCEQPVSARVKGKNDVRYVVMYACLILHNMILEDEGKAYCQDYTPGYIEPERERISMEERIANSNFMRNKEAHYALTADLVEHCWLNRRVTRYD
ncbi:hypothetical protein QVD17_00723 [Tagetes erecta]|uniref:Uncharacterized protein n=1 Tax=Tagetes erecta TaxID=13708 RepID=A0AAD8L5N4_TARER|nr:hypothetical protein QVD17_00723 [Tagetes erecta]